MSKCKIKMSISGIDRSCFSTRVLGYLYLLDYVQYLKPRLICAPQYTTGEAGPATSLRLRMVGSLISIPHVSCRGVLDNLPIITSTYNLFPGCYVSNPQVYMYVSSYVVASNSVS